MTEQELKSKIGILYRSFNQNLIITNYEEKYDILVDGTPYEGIATLWWFQAATWIPVVIYNPEYKFYFLTKGVLYNPKSQTVLTEKIFVEPELASEDLRSSLKDLFYIVKKGGKIRKW